MKEIKFIEVSVQTPVVTKGVLDSNTQEIWIVCHGYGQLAANFVRRFDVLPEDHFVIALQGMSKFYVGEGYRKVGASWMTKDHREVDVQNQMNYFEIVLSQLLGEVELDKVKINLLGFSQGASAICRMVSYHQFKFDNLILWAGSFPPELSASDFEYNQDSSKVFIVIGDQDEFVNSDILETETKLLIDVFGDKLNEVMFEGKHEIRREVLEEVVSKF
ncbi:MAG: hypothetical protein OCD76_12020 [Reichenbachiella sp.]